MRTHDGFTLVELLIVVTLIGILASIAAPSFNETILSQRVKSTSFDLIASLSYARSEAIKRNNSVTIAPVGGDWASGWTITAPSATTPGETDTLRSQASAQNITIDGPASIVYGRSGRVTTGAGSSVEIDDSQSNANIAPRCITLDPTGVPRAKQEACPS
jgi:type IV fimbrial biogenesis protein FimT